MNQPVHALFYLQMKRLLSQPKHFDGEPSELDLHHTAFKFADMLHEGNVLPKLRVGTAGPR
jgi:hypothetical protein